MALELIGDIFGHTLFFIIFIVGVFAVVGWFTGHFSLGAFSGFLLFTHIVVEQGNPLLTNALYVGMVLILFYAGAKLYGEAMGNDGVAS